MALRMLPSELSVFFRYLSRSRISPRQSGFAHATEICKGWHQGRRMRPLLGKKRVSC